MTRSVNGRTNEKPQDTERKSGANLAKKKRKQDPGARNHNQFPTRPATSGACTGAGGVT
jgi:hypothetical protein